MRYDDNMPIGVMTIGDLRELVAEMIAAKPQEDKKPEFTGRLVYGLHGISRLLGVSHVTAQRYKDSFLAPAIRQHGRKIIVDADMALQLFNDYRERK